jgi:hypothetical protein
VDGGQPRRKPQPLFDGGLARCAAHCRRHAGRPPPGQQPWRKVEVVLVGTVPVRIGRCARAVGKRDGRTARAGRSRARGRSRTVCGRRLLRAGQLQWVAQQVQQRNPVQSAESVVGSGCNCTASARAATGSYCPQGKYWQWAAEENRAGVGSHTGRLWTPNNPSPAQRPRRSPARTRLSRRRPTACDVPQLHTAIARTAARARRRPWHIASPVLRPV